MVSNEPSYQGSKKITNYGVKRMNLKEKLLNKWVIIPIALLILALALNSNLVHGADPVTNTTTDDPLIIPVTGHTTNHTVQETNLTPVKEETNDTDNITTQTTPAIQTYTFNTTINKNTTFQDLLSNISLPENISIGNASSEDINLDNISLENISAMTNLTIDANTTLLNTSQVNLNTSMGEIIPFTNNTQTQPDAGFLPMHVVDSPSISMAERESTICGVPVSTIIIIAVFAICGIFLMFLLGVGVIACLLA